MAEATAPAGAPYVLPPELLIDTGVARQIIGEFIRGHLDQTGFKRMVLALSGGLDSALVAYLLAESIGPDNLLCVMLPYRTSSPESRSDAEAVIAAIGCESQLIDITPMVDGYFGDDADVSPLRRGNFAARQRMAVLYDRSVTFGGLVVGTGNKTESLIGYTTIFGDNAAALQPIADLYKTQVRQLAADIGMPGVILRKPPTADLWAGQTDEQEVGLRYSDIDRLLYWSVDRRRTHVQLLAMGFDAANIERVERLVAGAEFKRQTAPIAKLGPRTPGVDYLYPRRRPRPAKSD